MYNVDLNILRTNPVSQIRTNICLLWLPGSLWFIERPGYTRSYFIIFVGEKKCPLYEQSLFIITNHGSQEVAYYFALGVTLTVL